MADDAQTLEQPQANQIPQELREQMSMALNLPQNDPLYVAPQINDNGIAAPSKELINTDKQSGTKSPEQQPITNPYDLIKEKFQYETPEAAIKEIEELRALKANPASAQIKYENEESERLHKAILAGKRDEVAAILNKQAQIEKLTALEVTKDTAAEIVKTGMQLKYKDLTTDEIEYKFKKQFSLPPKPVFNDAEETQEQYEQKVSTWQEQVNDKTMELMIEAKLAKPEIEAAKTKLELPAIQPEVDNDYLQWKKEQEEDKVADVQTKEAYKNFTPDKIDIKFDFNDEANKINFQYQFKPDETSFKETIDALTNGKFYDQFYNSDGSPNREKWFEFVYKGLHADKLITSGIIQGSNARLKAQLPNNNSTVRLMPQEHQMSELDKQMELAGIKRAG